MMMKATTTDRQENGMIERMTIERFRWVMDLLDPEEWEDYVNALLDRGRGPALCTASCKVEANDNCKHGHPALVVVAGSRAVRLTEAV
jgi:hypothetical protein